MEAGKQIIHLQDAGFLLDLDVEIALLHHLELLLQALDGPA